MRTKRNIVFVAMLALAATTNAWGSLGVASDNTPTEERKSMTREEYIAHYAPLAVEQQALFGIPASITLAQAVCESNNGNSPLALATNNHFGIKCNKDWTGPSTKHDDDAPQECFRAYASVEESYIDHSLILLERPWYQPLFALDVKDYKGWAHGLKAAGYATNPQYAYRLIEIIEKYELYKYDNTLLADYQPNGGVTEEPTTTEPLPEPAEQEVVTTEQELTPEEEPAIEVEQPTEKAPARVDIDSYGIAIQRVEGYGIYSEEGRRYIIASEGEQLANIARAVGVSERSLRLINDLSVNHTIAAGERIFIEK